MKGANAGDDELPGLCGRNESLKGKPQECDLSENGRLVEGGIIAAVRLRKPVSGTVAGGWEPSADLGVTPRGA